MFEEEIKSLAEKEAKLVAEITGIEDLLKESKAQLAKVKRAKKSLENAQSNADGQTDISE